MPTILPESQSQHHPRKFHIALKWSLTLASGLLTSLLVVVLNSHLGR